MTCLNFPSSSFSSKLSSNVFLTGFFLGLETSPSFLGLFLLPTGLPRFLLLEFGVVGLLNQNDPFYNLANQDPDFNYNPDTFMRDIGVYGKITIPLGAPKERLNCNTLYQLELRKKRLEVLKLEAELQQLKSLQFEDN